MAADGPNYENRILLPPQDCSSHSLTPGQDAREAPDLGPAA